MGDGPKKKKPIEDPRSEFFCTFVRKSMNLKADKLAKMMSSDENREIINEFLNNPENDLLICSKNQGGALSVQLKIPTSMAVGKCCYFRRTTINPLTLQNMGKELIYGDISCNPIENLTVVDEVMFPALNNPMNQVGWPNVLINSVTSKIQEFRNINTEIKGNMINRTLLPLPVTIDQAIKIAVKIKNDPNECDLKLKTSLELIVSKWSDQIEGILPADINILYENGMNPIPTDEMDFWNKRQLNLENILQQLRSVKIRTIARILEAVKSLHFNTFKTIFKNIVCALCETRDITLYLNPFRREVEKFQMTDFSDTKLYICPMLHVICLIWTNSEYYSTNDHISNLFRMINNMMIEEATKYLDPSSLFQGEITDILKKITESIDILKYYYARYRYYRNHLQDFKKPKTEIKLWTFNESPTFDRLNLFMTRLENILDVFNLANEFSKLEKIEVGGLNGKNIKRNLMKINEEFVELMHNWQNIQFDPLDPNPKTTDFDDVMTLFRETVDILERKLSYQINLAFDDCFSLDQATKLIQVLSTLLYVPIIRREIVPRFYDIIEMFNKELDLIKINFDDGKQNINEPIRTPIDNGFPPISGKIGWLLKIRNRITNHLSNLQIIDYFMNDTDEGVHAISKANEMLKIIDEYASEIFLPWSKQTIGDAGKCLKKYILTRNEDGLLAVNFDRILVTTLKEVKNLKLMNCEKYHKIPSGLLAISEQEEYFWDARIKLSRIVEWHTYIRNNTIDCEFNLIKHEMVKIDSSLEPGIKCDDWNHIDQDYIEKNYNLLKNLHSRIVKSQENVKMILDYINSWASIPTFHRKDNLPNSLLNFDDRKNILINRMNNYEQSSTIINEAMVLNYKLFSDTMESEPIPQEQEDEVVENNDDTISRSVEASETSNQEIISNVQSTDELDLIDSKLWLAYQEYVDALIGKEILNGITTSIRYIKNEISDVHQNNIPLVEVQYTLNAENHPTFIPELDENLPNSLLKKFEKMMRDIFTICYLIPRIVQPKEIKLNDDGEPIFNNFIHLLDSQTDIDNMQIDIFTQVKATTNEALAAYKVYMDYKHLWEVDRTEYLKQFLIYGRMLTESELNKIDDVKKASPSLNKFKEEIDRYTELLEEIKKFEKFKEFNIWLRINQQPFNMGCLSLASKWISLFKNHLIERVVDGLQELEDFIKESRDILSMTIDNDDLNGLLKVMNVIQQIDQRNLNVLKMFDVIKETIELLKEYDIIFNDNVDKVGGQLLMLPEDWNKLTKMALTVTQTIGPVKAYQIGLSEKRIELFNLQTKNYREKFINMPFFFAPCKNVYKLIDKTKKDLLQFEDSYNKLIDTVGIFKITPPNQTQLVVCSDELVLVKILWDFFKVVSTTVDKWKTTPWAKINVDSIETDCKQFVKDMRQLDKATRTWEPYIFIDTSIKNLMTSLRSIIELQNPAVRERHWNELMSETSLQFEMNDSMTLKELFDLNLHFYEEEIKNIVDKSVKEMAMEKGLAIIETTWRDMEFEYDVHDRTQTKIIRPSEELVEVLVDNQVQIQSMLSSKYKRFFEAQITDWQIKLSKADAVISAWFEVQRKWVYLESIFIASDDIRKQLTQEALRFDGVDEKFKKLLQEIYSDNNVISATNKSHILQSLETLQTDLVKCEKALNDYLETKRLAYPRFYFISSVDLLDILSNSNNPAMVAKHLTKLYDSLAHLKFDGSKRAIEMISKENEEHVKFLSPCDCSGNVEVWLNRITDTMRGTLRNLFNEANAAYESRPREKLILDFPAQPALCTTQIWWAVETNSAFAQIFKGNENALKDYNREQISQLNALINLLLGDLTVGDRQKIMTVCTIDVHSRDVVAKMIAQGIDTVTSFQWQSQLRHRWDKKLRDCFANICDAQFKYDYEYLGNTPRLVITPLTDRCYITLTQSLHLIMGGAPAGPAGTGKTETTKDLGRALGIMVYVFNCSDQMDYKSCANIYKGLAQTGAWGCFDEFNRIAIEVLSVIAVQVKTILDAVKMHKDIFNFMGETIKLITTVGMFITMNPGYAGRAELPENLKALFRPCAMVVPDFALICEIMLVAEGFQEARILARKFITLYNLCKELLSKQDHYDWGLRAIKSVLVVAGSLKRGDRQRPEDQVLMRALRDFNIPKIVTEDVPIFMGLIGDLFPALDVPRKRDVEFETMVKKSAIDLGLQPDDGFILKIVQLEELFAVRHSVFVNGFAGTGKSQVWKTLFRTYQNQKKKPHYNDLNPKAVTNDELFGVINPSTREWRDGLFSVIMRDQANMPGTGPKWIVLDGDIDPMWIESLNTLMDDNKVLTLASNERIALTKEMRLLFEISNLRTATPATVSRAGILYINPQDLGWNPYVMSWIDKRESAQEKSLLTGLFDKYIPPILESAKNRFKKITPISDIAMLQMTCFLLDCLLTPKNVPADVSKELFETYFVFAVIWGFGSTVFKDQLVDWRSEFSKWWLNEFKTIKFPGGGTIFSYYIDHNTKKFSPWTELVQPFELDSDIPLQSTLVSTSETTRLRYFMDMLIEKKQPLMLIGGAGSGKSVIVAEKLNNLSENYMVLNVPFNFYTTSKMLQTVLEKPLEKKAGRNFGPTGNKTMIYFIDDMNMPEVDTYGTVQPHTLVNQFMDYKHWYDREKLSLKDINNCQFISCMNPTAGSFTICPRLQRHFCSFAVNFPGPEALYHIYYSILSQHVSNPINKFNTNFLGRVEAIVNVAIALHVKVGQTFLPTAVKFHYIFNLRDMANIFQGIMFANGDTCRTVQMFYRLYIHEAMRVYGDKLVDRNDIQDFNKMLLDITKSGFESMDEEIVWHLPITFCHFAEGIADPKYATIPEWSVLRKLLDDSLINYNEIVGAMNLVLFEDAMSHICRINRILESPRGNGLLIGVGGSGKQSLTRLAAFISTMDVFQLQLRKGYSMVDLRNDLAALYLKTGIKNQPSIFLMTDSQVADETFLVLINDLLASGEISELFPDDEMENIINTIRNEVKQAGIFDTKENCWKFFIDKVRRTLKIILCFSPVGPTLRIRGRKFPAIVNCTAIDWFHEWPTEALESVSKRFLADLEVLPTHLIDSIGNFMAFVHNSVNEMSSVYLANEKRYNYTTPKSFLELISLYSKLLNEKVASTSERIQTLETGLIKLVACGEQIDGLKDVLKDQEVILIEKNQAADKLIAVVSAENEIVQTEKVFVAEEEAKVQIIKDSVSVTAKVCEEDLRKAQPALLAAQEALNTLNRDNLTELKSFANPPKIVETVLAGVLIFFSKGKIPKDRSWKAAKMMMNKVDVFLNNLLYFDKEHIQPQTIQAVMPYLNDPEFDPELIAKKSSAAAGLCAWVINIHKFYEVWLVVEPKQRALNAVQAELKAAQDKLFILNKKILDLEDQLSVIQMEFDQAMAEKQKCQKEADKTTRTIDLAHRLVNGLASENIRWRETVSQLKTSIEFLPGDVLLISCFISYVGCFTRPYRLELQAKLGLKFKTLDPKIPVGEESDPLKMICDDAIIAQWNNEGLPSDRMSAENATILTNSARWPLMIDPQLQGIKWIKQKYGAKLIVIRLTEPNYVKKIEKSIADGSILLIENIGETVDAVLEPLLGRFLIKKGKCMKIGDAEIDYNPDFRLILQTKLANPHYKPEMQAQTTLINFTVTKDGLEDQLLTEVVKAERPDLEELKSNLTMQQNSFKITLKNLEDDLLRRLSSAGPNVLEDETLVLNLEKTKMTAAEIGVKVAEAKITTVKIDEAREHYRIAAQRAAILYFILNEFFKVNPIYQFSLKAFTVVFKRAIETSPPSENLKERVGILIDNITYNVSQYTTRGLFEKDKIIFLAQLVIQIFVQEGNIAKEELDFLLKYPYQPNVTSPVSFLNNISWGGILSLSSLSNFSSLDKEIESLAKRWKTFVDSETPEKEKYPGEWKSKNALQKMCIMRCLRPDRMIYAIRECIEETLGTKFAEDRTIEFARSFEETSSSTPVFFILSPGVDPLKDVEKLGKVLQFSTENENFYNVSLGQGQEIVAEAAIENASKKGHWVILQNIHLVARWLSTLEKKMEETAEVAHQDYRLFISAEPAGSPEYHIIPQGILESSIKITNEPPSGMQANLHTALDNFSQDTLEMCTKESEFKAILFSLCYFHAVVAERRKFGPQGWNKIYPFNVGDLTICVYVLHNYLEANIRVPWEDLRYLFGEIMYGGHITDDWDRRLCRTYLEVLMQPDLVDGELELCNDFVSPPNSDYQGYHDYISENLPSESPYLYGLHPNAEIGFLTTTAERVFNVLFELQPRDSGASDGVQISREEVVKTKIEDIMDRLPEEYNMVEVMSRVEERTPFIIVAFQECERMNILVREMRRSLNELSLGLKGELTITSDMEMLDQSLYIDKVPDNWTKLAYPSLLGLSSWFADLSIRIQELEAWATDFTLPSSVWLAGFFNPQSFLTAIMQQTARKNEWPLDKMCLNCDVTKKQKGDFTMPPREGAYINGLFMEGARWDIVNGTIADSTLMELFPPMPVIYIKAVTQDKQDVKNIYECPVYKIRMRGPTYVWTFNLKTKEKPSKWTLAGVCLLLQS